MDVNALVAENEQLKKEVAFYKSYFESITIDNSMSISSDLSEFTDFRKVFDYMPYAIFWKDRDLKYVGCNSRFAAYAGIASPLAIAGMDDKDLPWHNEYVEVMLDDDKFIVETGETISPYEGLLTVASKHQIWVKFCVYPVKDENDIVIGIFGFFEDITQTKKEFNSLKKSHNSLIVKEQKMATFLSVLTREMRAPLSAVFGFTDMLSNDDISIHEVRNIAKLMQSQSNVLTKILTELNDIALIESQKLKVECKPFDIIALLKEEYLAISAQFTQNKQTEVKLRLALPQQQSVVVVGNRLRVQQIIETLIHNAISKTQSGFVELACKFENQKNVQISVKDSGIGIEPENLESIFSLYGSDQYYRNSIRSGLGVGLAIAKQLLELMKGELWVDSEPGMGSTFFFTLPCPIEEAEKKSFIEAASDLNFEQRWKGKTILIVDDAAPIHLVLKSSLKVTNIAIENAYDGEEALLLLEENNNIDIVLMDIRMPKLDGIGALKALKQQNSTIPVIAFSAFVTETDRQEILSHGFNSYLSKPFTKVELLTLLHRFLG